jgi:hypothetical protein
VQIFKNAVYYDELDSNRRYALRQNRVVVLAMGIGLLVSVGRLAAHHSFAGQFDSQKMFMWT